MRTAIASLFIVAFLIIGMPLYLVNWIIYKINRKTGTMVTQKICKLVCKIILKISGVKLITKGLENVPRDNACLFVFNHRSYFDIFICYSTVPVAAGFVSMNSLSRLPILPLWMRLLNCVFIDRKSNRNGRNAIIESINNINDGFSMFIAPEGRRYMEGDIDMLPFKEGSFRIAKKTGCPVIPVAINNADKIFEKSYPWIKSTIAVIEYGKPINVSDLSDADQKKMGKYSQGIIKDMLIKNQQHHL